MVLQDLLSVYTMVLEDKEALEVIGGFSLTGTFLTGIYKCINSMLEAGRSFGSALRRIIYNKYCPL